MSSASPAAVNAASPVSPVSAVLPPALLRALDPGQLVDLTRLIAAEVRAGAYGSIEFRDGQRWHRRIYRDRRVDVWLIGWLPSHATRLHDHGGSAGAFTVVHGALSEVVWRAGGPHRPAGLQAATRREGESVGFGPRYIHDVRNSANARAVSVHAYSTPLTSMTYYRVSRHTLTTLATVATDDPEAEWDG